DDARYTPEYRELYARRKETIERVFADAKEKHAMRYTQYRGLTQVTNWVKLKFAAMNLKKLAKWKWRTSLFCFRYSLFWLKYRQTDYRGRQKVFIYLLPAPKLSNIYFLAQHKKADRRNIYLWR
ncbi:MAG TPA: transposase, partial [Clostridia bacterium]|nr:transposase [Clostridia bacterium]